MPEDPLFPYEHERLGRILAHEGLTDALRTEIETLVLDVAQTREDLIRKLVGAGLWLLAGDIPRGGPQE